MHHRRFPNRQTHTRLDNAGYEPLTASEDAEIASVTAGVARRIEMAKILGAALDAALTDIISPPPRSGAEQSAPDHFLPLGHSRSPNGSGVVSNGLAVGDNPAGLGSSVDGALQPATPTCPASGSKGGADSSARYTPGARPGQPDFQTQPPVVQLGQGLTARHLAQDGRWVDGDALGDRL